MRIVLMGQAAFGEKTLTALRERGENVVAVYLPPDPKNGKIDPLKKAAQSYGIEVVQPTSYRLEDTLRHFELFKPDLLVMAFVTDIIPESFFAVPTRGAICYHPSLLPRHRGSSAINWAVIMGDEVTGLTIFWPDGGIDTGPVLLQKQVPIKFSDTTGSLYFEQLFPMGVEAIVESVDLIHNDQAPRKMQSDETATYEPPCKDDVAGVCWNSDAIDLYNLIRGCDPQPGAHASWEGKPVRFYEVSLGRNYPGEPGAIVDIDHSGMRIVTNGPSLVVKKLRGPDGKKDDAIAVALQHGMEVGMKFQDAVTR